MILPVRACGLLSLGSSFSGSLYASRRTDKRQARHMGDRVVDSARRGGRGVLTPGRENGHLGHLQNDTGAPRKGEKCENRPLIKVLWPSLYLSPLREGGQGGQLFSLAPFDP